LRTKKNLPIKWTVKETTCPSSLQEEGYVVCRGLKSSFFKKTSVSGSLQARSQSMHEATHADLIAEVDALNGIPPTPGPSALQQTQSKPGQLSKKTISMLTDLTAAASSVPPELEVHDRVLSEEELAERELAAEERRRTLEHLAAPSAPRLLRQSVVAGLLFISLLSVVCASQRATKKTMTSLSSCSCWVMEEIGETSLMFRASVGQVQQQFTSNSRSGFQDAIYQMWMADELSVNIWDTAGTAAALSRYYASTLCRGGLSGVAVSMLLNSFTLYPLNVRASCHHSSRHCVQCTMHLILLKKASTTCVTAARIFPDTPIPAACSKLLACEQD